ncbi:YveK family protein [Oceanobacillus halophilus]|uniref:Capsular biosynthesis protein n=1 Tax=Oceanobacillus halophilus TaxID=930130 RepID=A0A495A471_9BACI|nr:Wzz/FepE/Etk N-terminal domain-containing protein [Oceanobacillus halophilus]RKQ34291.1 capsular biosynthesis protein [Oceanobacillus halophilus]
MEETISLKEIFEVLKKRMILIISLTLGAAILAAVVSYFLLTPTYESSSQFIVNQKEQDPAAAQVTSNDIQTNIRLINTYNVIIKSPAILDEVIETLNLPYTTGALSEKINVASAQDSQVVTVTVTDENPATAVEIANTTVETFQNNIPEIMSVDNVSILTRAELSENPSPVAPNPILNIAIAIVLGVMVGVGIAFLLEYLDNTVTTEDDVEKKLGLPVIGVISQVSDREMMEGQVTFQQQQQRAKRGALNGAQKTS